MPEPIEVLLVDDQRLMRDGLRTLLELEPDLQIVGEVTDGAQAVEAYGALKPHVVLMDVRMPNMDGVEATRRIRQQWPQARILILTTFDDDAYVFEGIRAGAMGYLLKDVSGEELAAAIRTIAGGGALMGPEVAQRVMRQLAQMMPPGTAVTSPELLDPLSERELEVLHWMAQGLSNPEIARQLHLAEGTVKNYVSSVLQKTGTRDRTQAVLKAQSLGLL